MPGDRCGGKYPDRAGDRRARAVGEPPRRPALSAVRYGPEFIATALLRWLQTAKIDTAFIDPGKPWQNGTDESFNGKFRNECLSLEWFRNRMEATIGIERWRRHYNEERPHMSLGDLTPAEFKAQLEMRVYPGFPTLFWGLSVFFVGDLMGKALWKLVENAARFPRRGGRVLCVHGAVSFHRARPCGPRWLPGRGAMRHVELDRRVLGLQSTDE